MSTIRKQSILSSIVVYFGFALGFANSYLFAREGGFTKEQYGLTAIFIALANVMYSASSLGMPAYISKFFPYYNDHLENRKNDMLTRALIICTGGFAIITLAGIVFKDFVLARFANSPEIGQYYYWIFPFGYGLTLFLVMEPFGWHRKVPVLTNFLKEVLFRLLTSLLVILSTVGIIRQFSTFVHFYSFLYLAIALVLLGYLLWSGKAAFTTARSVVTRRLWPKVVALCSMVWGGGLILNLSSVFDTIVIAAVLPEGLALAAIYTLAQNISSLIQAPQRGIISSAVGPLAQAWKDKDIGRISRIYQRSSINQLLFACAMFSLIWLNFDDGVYTFNLQKGYLDAKWVFLFIGLYRVIDMGTGLNAQIISTSVFWKFEFLSGLVLLALALPLNYFLTKELGVIGPAISNLIAFTVYNGIRYAFLLRRFGMQPFSRATVYTLLLATACFCITYYLFRNELGLVWIVARSFVFITLYATGAFLLQLSPDMLQVLGTLQNKLGLKKG